MARCEDCFYHKMCYWIALFDEKKPCEHFISSADVVPKKEVARLQSQVNRLKKYDEERDIALHARLISNTRREVAREIFAELQEMVIPEKCTDGCAYYLDMAELTALEKKYTEGEI